MSEQIKPGRPVTPRAAFNGPRLRMLRTQRGWSAEKVGSALGMSGRSVLNLEIGTCRPSAQTVKTLERLFKVTAATFKP
jgi:transcriptional regulator with XRE-family HTH domain